MLRLRTGLSTIVCNLSHRESELLYAIALRAQTAASRRFLHPLAEYKSRIQRGELNPDSYQEAAVKELELLYNAIRNYTPKPKSGSGFFGSLFGSGSSTKEPTVSTNAPQGMYMWGSVGGGKTTVMDLFYDCCTEISQKQRVHFNSFMTRVHANIHEEKQTQGPRDRAMNSEKPAPYDPIRPVADRIAKESWLICFDEFQVTDIADAMILKRLFTHLFNDGVVVVATSNRQPTDLYKNGLQRSNFLPFIDLLLKRCKVVPLSSGIDYRRRGQTSGSETYFVKSQVNANAEMDRVFKSLCSQENDIIRPRTITHLGRNLDFKKTCGQILDSSFSELCDRPLASSDYLQVAQAFHTVLIRDVPQMRFSMRAQLRRFILLIDTLYDNRTRVVISADVPLSSMFNLSDKPTGISDSDRALMDDLNISLGSNEAASSVFTGEEELFAYDRTQSRLHEMQTKSYWDQWTKHR